MTEQHPELVDPDRVAQQVERSKQLRLKMADAAEHLAATEEKVAAVHERMAETHPQDAERHHREVEDARRLRAHELSEVERLRSTDHD